MSVSELIGQAGGRTAFSIELLPPLKGNSIDKLYADIDALRQFEPRYINITTHRSEYVYAPLPDGRYEKRRVRRRPGTVAVAAAIQNKYGICVVPHVLCSGFTREETEYELIDLQFLGITNLLLLRGDKAPDEKQFTPQEGGHAHSVDLARQVARFNQGVSFDGSGMNAPRTPFSFGVACYPEKHEEAPNMETDLHWLKMKQEAGAEYAVTQLFYDNRKFFHFLQRAREAGITIPIIPGIKPLSKMSQMTVVPRTFKVDLPKELTDELERCATDRDAAQVGVEWSIGQCRELMAHGVPGIHFYTVGCVDSVRRIAQAVY